MHINQLETLLQVAARKSFHAAAERLRITQPAVSARIAALEAELGMTLLDRRGREVSLTKDGVEVSRYAQEVLRLTDDLRKRHPALAPDRRSVRLGIVGTLAYAWLTPLVRAIASRFPLGIEIVVESTTSLRAMLTKREIDVAFIVGVNYDPNVRSVWITQYELEWLGKPALLGNKRTMSIKDLAKQTIVTYEEGTHVNFEIQMMFKAAGLWPARLIGCNSVGMIVDLVRKGIGIGALPRPTVAEWIEAGEIVPIRAKQKLPVFDVFVCYSLDSAGSFGADIAELGRSVCAAQRIGG